MAESVSSSSLSFRACRTSLLARLRLIVLMAALAGCAAPEAPTPAPTAAPATPATALGTAGPTVVATAAPTAAAATTAATSAPTLTAERPILTAASPTPPFPTEVIGEATLGRLRPLRTIGYGGAQSAALAPDGRLLAVGTTAGLVLIELPALRTLRFTPVEGGVKEIAFAPGGAILATTRDSYSPRSELWRIADGVKLGDVDGYSPLFSRDGALVATQGKEADGEVATILSRARDGERLTAVPGVAPLFDPNGRFVAVRSAIEIDPLPSIRLYDLAGQPQFEVPGRLAAFSPDGLTLAVASDADVTLYHVSGERAPNRFALEGRRRAKALAFTQDNQALMALADNDLLVWRLAEHRLRSALPELIDRSEISSASFSPDAATLVVQYSIGDGAITRFLRTSDGGKIVDDGPWSSEISFSDDSSLAVLLQPDGFSEGRALVLNLHDGSTSSLALASFHNVAFSPDAQTLAASNGSSVGLWRVTDGALLRTLVGDNAPIGGENSDLRFTPDGATLGLAGELNVPYGGPAFGAAGWHVPEGDKPSWTGAPPSGPPPLVWAASPSGVTAASDGANIRIARQGSPDLTISMPVTVTALTFSTDGELLAAADESRAIWLVRSTDGAPMLKMAASSQVRRLVFSSHATLVGAVTTDAIALAWRVSEPEPLAQLSGVPADARLIFSEDDQIAVAGGEQGVAFYRLTDGALLQSLPVSAEDIAIGPRRRMLAVLHGGIVQLWGIPL